MLDLYEADPDPRWLRDAIALQAELDRHYADELGGGYFKTADDQERLLAREKPSRDGAIPSGNSVAALNLQRLADFTGGDRHRQIVMGSPPLLHLLLVALRANRAAHGHGGRRVGGQL